MWSLPKQNTVRWSNSPKQLRWQNNFQFYPLRRRQEPYATYFLFFIFSLLLYILFYIPDLKICSSYSKYCSAPFQTLSCE